jgi:hypothetical protein
MKQAQSDVKENIFKNANLQNKEGKKKEKTMNEMNKEIDFEVNKLLKQEIVDLKLEIELLNKEKESWEQKANNSTRDLLLKKQNLESINVDINKGSYCFHFNLKNFSCKKKNLSKKKKFLN